MAEIVEHLLDMLMPAAKVKLIPVPVHDSSGHDYSRRRGGRGGGRGRGGITLLQGSGPSRTLKDQSGKSLCARDPGHNAISVGLPTAGENLGL